MATIEIRDEGHESQAFVDDEQIAYLDAIVDQWKRGAAVNPTRANAAAWAIEQAREAWVAEGGQDGPSE